MKQFIATLIIVSFFMTSVILSQNDNKVNIVPQKVGTELKTPIPAKTQSMKKDVKKKITKKVIKKDVKKKVVKKDVKKKIIKKNYTKNI